MKQICIKSPKKKKKKKKKNRPEAEVYTREFENKEKFRVDKSRVYLCAEFLTRSIESTHAEQSAK